MTFLDPISGFFSRVSRSVPFSKKKDPRRGGGPTKIGGSWQVRFLPHFLEKISEKSNPNFCYTEIGRYPPIFSSKILEKIGRYPLPLRVA